jgi:hypothetical protein
MNAAGRRQHRELEKVVPLRLPGEAVASITLPSDAVSVKRRNKKTLRNKSLWSDRTEINVSSYANAQTVVRAHSHSAPTLSLSRAAPEEMRWGSSTSKASSSKQAHRVRLDRPVAPHNGQHGPRAAHGHRRPAARIEVRARRLSEVLAPPRHDRQAAQREPALPPQAHVRLSAAPRRQQSRTAALPRHPAAPRRAIEPPV